MNEFLSSVVEGLAYSVGGFLVGLLVGHEARTRHIPRDNESRRLSPVAIVVLVLALVTVFQSAYFSWEQRRGTECLAQYNEDFAIAAQQRTAWADEDRAALKEFMKTYRRSGPEEEKDAAWEALVSTYDQNDKNREATPYPDENSCD